MDRRRRIVTSLSRLESVFGVKNAVWSLLRLGKEAEYEIDIVLGTAFTVVKDVVCA